jgi:predicted dehydrogenase
MTLKVALVGCGKIADGHIEEIKKLGRAKIVAVCDLELLMAEQVAVRYAIPAHYDDVEKMLAREQPDVVHITTPPRSHLPLARLAVDAGCHVFVEKPFALTFADACQMIDCVESAGKKVTVGYSYLFDPPAVRMREIVGEGRLGEIVHVESFYGYNLDGPFGAAIMSDPSHWVHSLPGGLLQNNIDHMLYKVTEFVQDERPEIRAVGAIRRTRRYGDQRDRLLDELRVIIQGEQATGYGTFSSHARPVGHFARVYGTKNTMHVDYVSRSVVLEPTGSLPGVFGRLTPPFASAGRYWNAGASNLQRFAQSDFQFFAGLNALIARFYDAIAGDTAPPIPYRDIRRIAAMMDEIFSQTSTTGAGR